MAEEDHQSGCVTATKRTPPKLTAIHMLAALDDGQVHGFNGREAHGANVDSLVSTDIGAVVLDLLLLRFFT